MKTAKYLLLVVGAGLLIYAISFLVKPELLEEMVGLSHQSPNALVEITAFYGGLELGLGIYFIWASMKPERYAQALFAFAITFICAGVARMAGIILYGFEDPSQPTVSAIEIVIPLWAFWLRKKIVDSGSVAG